MKQEVLNLINQNALSPFNPTKTTVKSQNERILKTKDAKAIYTKTLSTLSKPFFFADTANLWLTFPLTKSQEEIEKRQAFFQNLKQQTPIDRQFLKQLTKPRPTWKPKYNLVIVTEDESTFSALQKINCPAKYIITQQDVETLKDYDLIQAIDCENFKFAIEQLPQSIFLSSLDDVYLERFLEQLSSWEHNLEILSENQTNPEIQNLLEKISPALELIQENNSKALDRKEIESALIQINAEIAQKIKEITVSGESLFTMLSKNNLPPELEKIIRDSINKTNYSLDIFNTQIPVTIDEEELDKRIKLQQSNEYTNLGSQVLSQARILRQIPELLTELSNQILFLDFSSGILQYLNSTNSFPQSSNKLSIEQSKSLFINNAQPVSFHLSENHQCSILTGANSGGKTTLLEHTIQLLTLHQLGLPTHGSLTTPLFTEIYYFAKNKGSMSKGAFETLLTQMSEIQPGNQTLILADEIEAVTEPGVAGKMICATAQYFITQKCFLVIATHLGQEIQKNLPNYARIDGIEAKGLTENYDLIIDHNPVLGRLAHSTPELIVEKMANSQSSEYIRHLHEFLKN